MNKIDLKKLLYKEFKDWLIGIIEDDPLPLEIKTIYFLYGNINGLIYIRFIGTEIDKEEESDFTYNPLEAQFFNSNYLYELFNGTNLSESLFDFLEDCISKIKNVYELKELKHKKIKIKQVNYYI